MKFKFSNRERWLVTVAPTLAILAVYGFFVMDGLYAEAQKQQKRVAELARPVTAVAPSASVATSKKALEDAKKTLAERQTQVAQLETFVASTKGGVAASDDHDAVHVIEKVEAVFARNKLTPLISEAVADGANTTSNALVAKLTGDIKTGHASGRVWHCIFDDVTPNFDRAFKELAREVPAVVPLSLNLVYNPDNDGETRLLELWLLY
jgi:hypothetical protein